MKTFIFLFNRFVPRIEFPSCKYFRFWIPVWVICFFIGTAIGWICKFIKPLILILCLACVSVEAQTNVGVVRGMTIAVSEPPDDPPQHPLPPNIKSDLEKLFSDILDSVSFSGSLQGLFAAWLSARLLRKGLPDGIQTGMLGTILKHAALEINPQLAPEIGDVEIGKYFAKWDAEQLAQKAAEVPQAHPLAAGQTGGINPPKI